MRSCSKQKSEENIDLEQIVTGTLAYNGFNDAIIVRIPDYADTPQEWKSQKLHAIRVRGQKTTIHRRAFVYLRIPKYLTGSSKAKKFSMGERFGTIPSWRNFVASYVWYAVCNVDSFDAPLSSGALINLTIFVSCCKDSTITKSKTTASTSGKFDHHKSQRMRGMLSTEVSMPLRLVVVLVCFANIQVNTSSLLLKFPPVSLINGLTAKARERVSKLGVFYQVTVGGNFVDVPTDASFAAKAIPIGFIVNHRVTDPTHFLTTSKGKASLKPFRAAQKEEEFCFNYRYELSDDVPTQEE